MKFTFRTDASLKIGTGHVKRCLTLAKALRDRGAKCSFICREHEGNMIEKIRQEGFECITLAKSTVMHDMDDSNGAFRVHAEWLGASWKVDAQQTIQALGLERVDWLVADHYALDVSWHSVLRHCVGKILIIDDLANRQLDCDIVLDQNLGREGAHYDRLICSRAIRLLGSEYTLLRPDFASMRDESWRRVRVFPPRSLLLVMGGIDAKNSISHILNALAAVNLTEGLRVTVGIGAQAPHLERLRTLIPNLPFVVDLRIDAANMAELMLNADLAISASGLIIYELACMGVPALLLPLTDIQREKAKLISQNTCAIVLDDWESDPVVSIRSGIESLKEKYLLSRHCDSIVDGLGCKRVIEVILRASYV